jgi:hypothetical protein
METEMIMNEKFGAVKYTTKGSQERKIKRLFQPPPREITYFHKLKMKKLLTTLPISTILIC